MRANLLPIRVLLRQRANGHLDWPDFNRLPPEVRQGLEWSRFIDRHGIGWHYDHVENIGKGTGHDTACTLVPAEFAEAAAATFPERVTLLDEAEFERFYDERAHAHEETEMLDKDVLQAILARVQLEEKGIAPPPSAEILALRQKALDPNDPRRGIRKNPRRRWADAKAMLGVSVRADAAKA
ncbi:MAG: hypothetical protein WD069_03755 [Planctomycetales bacterium]